MLLRMQAVESWLATQGNLPLKIKWVIEGEEEIGSPNLGKFVRAHRELIEGADGCLWEFGAKDINENPMLICGLKGITYFELHAHGGSGHDFMDGDEEGFRTICQTHARHGTTSICPTSTAAVTGSLAAHSWRSTLPRTACVGASARNWSSTSGLPMSPAWTITSDPRNAATASGRSRPCVSEMTPTMVSALLMRF